MTSLTVLWLAAAAPTLALYASHGRPLDGLLMALLAGTIAVGLVSLLRR